MEHDSLTEQTVTIEPIVLDRKQNFLQKLRTFLLGDLLLFLTVAGIVVGFALGFGIRELHPSKDALMWLGMPGELFMRMLKLMILPLIVCSVISGTASLDPKANSKISAVAFVYIVITNTLPCIEAIIIFFIFKPGTQGIPVDEISKRDIMESQDIFADLLRNIIPDNMVEAAFRQAQTKYGSSTTVYATNSTNGSTVMDTITTVTKSLGKTNSVNVLGLITACTMIGMAASTLKEKADVFVKFFIVATDIVLIILRKFYWVAPIGIASLIAVSIAGVTNLTSTLSQLGIFVLAVIVGLIFHTLIVLPAILFVLTRRNPFAFLATLIRPCLIGFATTSTAIALPEMIESCEVQNGIDSRITRFVVPFSVTLNADGSALFLTSAALFIAQLSGIDITAGDIMVVGVLAAVSSLALPSVPSASIVALLIILTSANIPSRHIALLFAVEWILDRLRSTTNVVSHTFNAAVTYQFCKANLRTLDRVRTSTGDKEFYSTTKLENIT